MSPQKWFLSLDNPSTRCKSLRKFVLIPMVLPYDYTDLPAIVLVDIFSFLKPRDLFAASSTCKSWRQIFYHPKLWSSTPYRCLRLTLLDRHQDIHSCRYLITNFLSLTRSIEIRFDPTNINIIKDLLQILDTLVCTNRQLKILRLRPISTRCGLAENEQPLVPLCDKWVRRSIVTNRCSLFVRIFHLLKQIIESNQAIEILSFGCWFESLFRVEELIQILAQRQAHSIKQLHLASIKNSETHTFAGQSRSIFEGTFKHLFFGRYSSRQSIVSSIYFSTHSKYRFNISDQWFAAMLCSTTNTFTQVVSWSTAGPKDGFDRLDWLSMWVNSVRMFSPSKNQFGSRLLKSFPSYVLLSIC